MKTKKPFNLEAALNGARVETENGTLVTNLHYFKGATNSQSLVGLHHNEVTHWRPDGQFHMDGMPCCLDLVIVEEVDREPCYWAYVGDEGWTLASIIKTTRNPSSVHACIPVRLVPLDD